MKIGVRVIAVVPETAKADPWMRRHDGMVGVTVYAPPYVYMPDKAKFNCGCVMCEKQGCIYFYDGLLKVLEPPRLQRLVRLVLRVR